MDADDLTELISRRWTASELVEFLGIEVEDIVETYKIQIQKNLNELLEEIGYNDFEELEDET